MNQAILHQLQNITSIENLPFTDLYVRIDDPTVPARFRPDPTRASLTGNFIVPRKLREDIEHIRSELSFSSKESEGTLTHKGLRMRYVKFETDEGEHWAALRAVTLELPSLDDLGMDPAFIRIFRGWGRRRGLILVGGRTGDGKTTTCVAAIRDFLERMGGFAYTVEDPPEYQMQGAISDSGFCLQVKIDDDSKWSQAMKAAMRSRPDYILIGEIRTPEAAEQLLKAVTSGHLVLTTIHGGSVPDSVNALLQLAERRMGMETARSILADRLIAAVHQTLGRHGPTMEVLEPKRESNTDPTAGIIKDGELAALRQHVVTYQPSRIQSEPRQQR